MPKGQVPHRCLKRFRETVGLTQLQLAESIGVSYSYLQAIELGRKPMNPSFARRLLHHFGVDPNSLLDPEGTPMRARSWDDNESAPLVPYTAKDYNERRELPDPHATADAGFNPPIDVDLAPEECMVWQLLAAAESFGVSRMIKEEIRFKLAELLLEFPALSNYFFSMFDTVQSKQLAIAGKRVAMQVANVARQEYEDKPKTPEGQARRLLRYEHLYPPAKVALRRIEAFEKALKEYSERAAERAAKEKWIPAEAIEADALPPLPEGFVPDQPAVAPASSPYDALLEPGSSKE